MRCGVTAATATRWETQLCVVSKCHGCIEETFRRNKVATFKENFCSACVNLWMSPMCRSSWLAVSGRCNPTLFSSEETAGECESRRGDEWYDE